MKKIIVSVCLALLFTMGTPLITNIGGEHKAEAASVVGKSYTYYLSESQVKELYKSMKRAQTIGGWASIVVGFIPGGQAASVGIALGSSAVAQKEVEKAYYKNMRLKVTYTYGVTMSLNTTTFEAVK